MQRPPVTDSYRSQTATDQNVNFRTNRRKEMKDTNVLSDTNLSFKPFVLVTTVKALKTA